MAVIVTGQGEDEVCVEPKTGIQNKPRVSIKTTLCVSEYWTAASWMTFT